MVVYNPLRNRNSKSLVFLVSSLGIFVVIQNIISLIWGDNLKSINVGESVIGNNIMGAYITNNQLVIVFIGIILYTTLVIWLEKSKIGKQIRSVSSNKELAVTFGINSDRIILLSVVIGSLIASITGLLVGFEQGIKPNMGFNLLLFGAVAMIIGGAGSIYGLIGGALILASAQHLGAFYIGSKWMDAIAYLILIVFLIWKPLGFSGRQLKKTEI